jgi:hypothetical protein
MSKCVWALEKEDITDFIGAMQEEDARAWLAKVLSSLPQEDMVRVVVTIWAIWHARRKALHENLFQGPLSMHAFIDKFVSELGETTTVRTKERQLEPSQEVDPSSRRYGQDQRGCRCVDELRTGLSGSHCPGLGRKFHHRVFRSLVWDHGNGNSGSYDVPEGPALATDALLSKVRAASDCSNVV